MVLTLFDPTASVERVTVFKVVDVMAGLVVHVFPDHFARGIDFIDAISTGDIERVAVCQPRHIHGLQRAVFGFALTFAASNNVAAARVMLPNDFAVHINLGNFRSRGVFSE